MSNSPEEKKSANLRTGAKMPETGSSWIGPPDKSSNRACNGDDKDVKGGVESKKCFCNYKVWGMIRCRILIKVMEYAGKGITTPVGGLLEITRSSLQSQRGWTLL